MCICTQVFQLHVRISSSSKRLLFLSALQAHNSHVDDAECYRAGGWALMWKREIESSRGPEASEHFGKCRRSSPKHYCQDPRAYGRIYIDDWIQQYYWPKLPGKRAADWFQPHTVLLWSFSLYLLKLLRLCCVQLHGSRRKLLLTLPVLYQRHNKLHSRHMERFNCRIIDTHWFDWFILIFSLRGILTWRQRQEKWDISLFP